ncbi:MAG: DUF5694 domain-containing protein [Candidatus Eisenbacteria bacterium]
MNFAVLNRRSLAAASVLALLASVSSGPIGAAPQDPPPARVMLLGTFHFDNPGHDAVKFTPIDVMLPEQQEYVVDLARRLSDFAPTKVVLEYPSSRDSLINARYADYIAGRLELPRNEIYQLGFRVARLRKHARVYGFDAALREHPSPLWEYLGTDSLAGRKFDALIQSESSRLQALHSTASLKEVLAQCNDPREDDRNKGFYMLLNPVAAESGQFLGADVSADWWQRNLRMYALLQLLATPGERLLVIAGSGHTALLRDFLRADGERRAEDVRPYF